MEWSFLEHGDPYTGKTTSLCWDGPQVFIKYQGLDKKRQNSSALELFVFHMFSCIHMDEFLDNNNVVVRGELIPYIYWLMQTPPRGRGILIDHWFTISTFN